jgi:hypothetical protein
LDRGSRKRRREEGKREEGKREEGKREEGKREEGKREEGKREEGKREGHVDLSDAVQSRCRRSIADDKGGRNSRSVFLMTRIKRIEEYGGPTPRENIFYTAIGHYA